LETGVILAGGAGGFGGPVVKTDAISGVCRSDCDRNPLFRPARGRTAPPVVGASRPLPLDVLPTDDTDGPAVAPARRWAGAYGASGAVPRCTFERHAGLE